MFHIKSITFRDATGTFYNDRWKPLIEGVFNLILSIALVNVIGVAGVIVATIITNLLICHIVEPYVLYKNAFKVSPKGYYLRNYSMILLFSLALLVLENLAKTDGFLSYSKKVFREECIEAIDEILTKKIPEYTTTIKKSAESNAFRWSNKDFDFNAEIGEVSSYLKEHTNFLYRVWIEGEDICQVAFVGLQNDLFYSLPKGGVLSEIPTVKDTEYTIFKGFYYSDTNEPFDKSKPITEDTEIYAKWENKKSNPIKTAVKYSPVLVIAVVFIVLIIIDFKRNKRGGGNE